MLKNAQFKIIVIFFVVGIILIGTLGAFYIYSLENVKMQIATNTVTEVGQVSQEINQIKHNTVISLGIVVIVFAIIGCLISAFLSEFVIYPINKLIKSAEKVTVEDGKNKTKNKNKPCRNVLLHGLFYINTPVTKISKPMKIKMQPPNIVAFSASFSPNLIPIRKPTKQITRVTIAIKTHATNAIKTLYEAIVKPTDKASIEVAIP